MRAHAHTQQQQQISIATHDVPTHTHTHKITSHEQISCHHVISVTGATFGDVTLSVCDSCEGYCRFQWQLCQGRYEGS